jgi:hypothetical protein
MRFRMRELPPGPGPRSAILSSGSITVAGSCTQFSDARPPSLVKLSRKGPASVTPYSVLLQRYPST